MIIFYIILFIVGIVAVLLIISVLKKLYLKSELRLKRMIRRLNRFENNSDSQKANEVLGKVFSSEQTTGEHLASFLQKIKVTSIVRESVVALTGRYLALMAKVIENNLESGARRELLITAFCVFLLHNSQSFDNTVEIIRVLLKLPSNDSGKELFSRYIYRLKMSENIDFNKISEIYVRETYEAFSKSDSAFYSSRLLASFESARFPRIQPGTGKLMPKKLFNILKLDYDIAIFDRVLYSKLIALPPCFTGKTQQRTEVSPAQEGYYYGGGLEIMPVPETSYQVTENEQIQTYTYQKEFAELLKTLDKNCQLYAANFLGKQRTSTWV